jgi:hypothetical protein
MALLASALRATTKRIVLAQIDAKIDALLEDDLRWFQAVRSGKRKSHQRRLLGVALLIDNETSEGQ